MKTFLIISFFTALCVVFVTYPADAQKKQEFTPATHMWTKTGLSILTFVPVRSLEQCEMLTRQGALLNSLESACFNGKEHLKTIACTKPVRENREATCE